MILDPWEKESLENLRRVLTKGESRGIETRNPELLDFCSHALNILGELKDESESKKFI